MSTNSNGFFENILASSAEGEKTLEISKDISLEIDSKSLLSTKNAYSLQIFTFDSPLVTLFPQENSTNNSTKTNTLNNFISITVLNEKGEEISIKNIIAENRPKILYDKDEYSDLKGCYYYDEKEQILKTDGMFFDDNYEYNNKKYYKCESSHLTMFTAGTTEIADKETPNDGEDGKDGEDGEDGKDGKDDEDGKDGKDDKDGEDDKDGKSSGVKSWHVILISFGVLAVIILLVIIICHFKKNKVNSETIDSSFGKNEGLMKEELM